MLKPKEKKEAFTIRITAETKAKMEALKEKTKLSMNAIAEHALERLLREEFSL